MYIYIDYIKDLFDKYAKCENFMWNKKKVIFLENQTASSWWLFRHDWIIFLSFPRILFPLDNCSAKSSLVSKKKAFRKPDPRHLWITLESRGARSRDNGPPGANVTGAEYNHGQSDPRWNTPTTERQKRVTELCLLLPRWLPFGMGTKYIGVIPLLSLS